MSNPNIAEASLRAGTRFPVNRKNHTQKHPNGYLTCRLRRFLKKKIKYEDPETQQFIQGNVGDALMWRLILNGTQGDNQAIETILDRVEGKVNGNKWEVIGNPTQIIVIRDGNKTENISGRISVLRSEIPCSDSGGGNGKDIISIA